MNSLNFGVCKDFQEPGMNHLLMLYEESKHIAYRGLDAKKRHAVVMVITQELSIGGKRTTRL